MMIDLSLEHTAWTLIQFADRELSSFDAETTPVTALFADGRVAGRSGCNRYTTSYTIDGDAIRFGHVATTRMMCPPEQMAVERAFLRALESAFTFRIEGRQLTIAYEGGQLMFQGE